jgi:hypothetical protein
MSLISCPRKLFRSVAATGLLISTAAVLVAGCSAGKKAAQSPTTTAGTQGAADGTSITLLESGHNDGPWSRALTRPLGKAGVPVQFYLCGVRGQVKPTDPCLAASPGTLPAGATFRLEQQPVGPGVERPDSPGWGLVGTADSPAFQLSLSDFVSTNNKPGKVTYRATLRDPDGNILGTSNTVTVTWHR